MNQGADDPSFITASSLNATVYSSIASAITALGGAAIGVAKAIGADIPTGTAAAALGVVAVGVLSLALIVTADVRARAAVKVATIQAGIAAPVDARRDDGGNTGPLVEVNVRRDSEVDVVGPKPGPPN
jgi:hypothetical protein